LGFSNQSRVADLRGLFSPRDTPQFFWTGIAEIHIAELSAMIL
jgi:hypothetical protein